MPLLCPACLSPRSAIDCVWLRFAPSAVVAHQVARQQPVRRRDCPGGHHGADESEAPVRPRRSCRAVSVGPATNAPFRDLGKCNVTGRVPSAISMLTALTKLCASSPARLRPNHAQRSACFVLCVHAFYTCAACAYKRAPFQMRSHANTVHASPLHPRLAG